VLSSNPKLFDRSILPSWLLFLDAGLVKLELLLLCGPLDTIEPGCLLFRPELLLFARFAVLDRLLADDTEPVFGLDWALSKRLPSDVPERLVVVDIN
jgi:hypothetical protein